MKDRKEKENYLTLSWSFVSRLLNSEMARNSAETFLTRIFLICLGLITTVIIARILGPEGRGIYAVAVAVAALGSQLGNLGLHASCVYFVARDNKLLPALWGNAISAGLAIGVLVSIVVCFMVTFFNVFSLLKNNMVLYWTLVLLPISLIYLLAQNLLLGLQLIRTYNVVEIIAKVSGVFGIITLFFLDWIKVDLILAITVCSSIIATVICLKKLNSMASPEFSWPVFKNMILYGIKPYFSDLISFIMLKSNILFVGFLLGAEEAGYYSIVVQLSDIIIMLPMTIGMIAFPRISAMQEGQWEFIKKLTQQVALLMIVICIIAALLAKPMIPLLFGKSFIKSIPLFSLSLIGIYFLSVQSVLVKYLAARGYPVSITFAWFFAMVLNLSLTLTLIHKVGLYGVVWSSVITNLFLMIEIVYLTVRHHRLSIKRGLQ